MVVIVVAVIIHSLDMAFKCNDFYIVIVSLVVCAIIGGMDKVLKFRLDQLLNIAKH